MKQYINLDRLEAFVCLEPHVGDDLLPRYPEFLEEDERQRFEMHRAGCELCQERWTLWQASGLMLRVAALQKRAAAEWQAQRFETALDLYNHAIRLDPEVVLTDAGPDFLSDLSWMPLTAASANQRDIMPYFAPDYAPEVYQLAAAGTGTPFPIAVEYAGGKVRGRFSVAGRQVFFELLNAEQEFQQGVNLLGKIQRNEVASFKLWQLQPGERQRLETVRNLFGAAELPEILQALKNFKVFPAIKNQ